MRRRVVLLALALVACAPSQARLLDRRHFPEALAGVDEGALDGGAVLAAIAAELEVGLHVQAVPRDMLSAHLPGGAAGLEDVALVRVVHDSHAVPLYHAVVSVTLLQGGVPAPTIDASLPALAARTGETLPQSTVIHHPGTTDYRPVITTKRPLLEMFARVAFNVATVGVLHSVVPIVRDEGTPARTEVRPPSDEDYARESPAAEALSRWLSTPACGEPGERCERWFLWPRSLASPLELAVVVHLRSYDPPALVYRLELQPGALEASLQQTFGDRIRPLAALARSSGAGLTVSWVLEYLSFEADSDRLTPASLRRLRRQLDGTRRHPGLRGRPELRFTVELGADAPQRERRAMRLREALRSGGVAAEQIELTETVGASVTLRVRHAVALE